MKKIKLLLILTLAGLALATTYHTLPFNGQNSFATDEDFRTSTDTIFAYCTWDNQYLYLAYSGQFLATPNDTIRSNIDMFFYIDTDPHPDNPKSGLGTDSTGSYYTQIMPSFPWWFDEQKWVLPFYADYRVKGIYDRKDSVYAHIQPYDNNAGQWTAGYDIDTSHANLNYVDGYYELRIPLDSLGNPPDIFILGYLVSNEWKSDLYYNPDPQRDVGGTLGSWPWSSIEGGDGDHHTEGRLNHWFHFHLQPGIHPDQENDPPVASAIDNQTINEGQSFAVIDLNSYVFDDLTPDTLLTWTTTGTVDLTVTIADSNQATVNIPNPQWNGSETITFIVTDEGGKSDTTQGTFTVVGDNQIPVAQNDSSNTPEDTAVSINLTANDSDPDGEPVHIDRILNTNNGSVTIDNDSMVTYTPAKDFNGTDTFDYVVTDGNGGRDTATVYVTVAPRNDPPQIVNLPNIIDMETNSSTQLYMMNYAYDVDTPDSLLTWSFSVSDPAIGYAYDDVTDTLTIFSYNTAGEFYLFTTLTDDSGASDKDTITVRVSQPSAIGADLNKIPQEFKVFQNYPNPFNPTTTVVFGIPKATSVELTVFNILGQPVMQRFMRNLSAGYHRVSINAEQWSAGIYFYRLRAGNRVQVKKMILVR